MKKTHYILLLMSIVVMFNMNFKAQQRENFIDSGRIKSREPIGMTFNKIEKGISSGKVSELSAYFSSQMYLNLSNGISGYYSSNQAYYILEDFFDTYHVTEFKFDNIQNEESSLYATGSYHFLFKGKRDVAQVYVSVRQAGKKWKITQININ